MLKRAIDPNRTLLKIKISSKDPYFVKILIGNKKVVWPSKLAIKASIERNTLLDKNIIEEEVESISRQLKIVQTDPILNSPTPIVYFNLVKINGGRHFWCQWEWRRKDSPFDSIWKLCCTCNDSRSYPKMDLLNHQKLRRIQEMISLLHRTVKFHLFRLILSQIKFWEHD